MTFALTEHLGTILRWMGRRSSRETKLMWGLWLVALFFLLGEGPILSSWHSLTRERIRLAASKVSLQELEQLLERREEILARADGLIDDFLESQELEASTLLLQRIDRLRDNGTQLISVFPLGGRNGGNTTRFRANFVGSPGKLARLFFELGRGAPPIVLCDLTLMADRRSPTDLAAAALFEVELYELPPECVLLLAEGDETSKTQQTSVVLPPFPYISIDRRGVFETSKRSTINKRLGQAAPTIENLMRELSLLGVIWGEEPKAIIADRSEGQTHYRRVGQFIGELEVIEISRSSVTLQYKDEEGRLE